MNWISRLLLSTSNTIYYGGQAVIGGVMMKGKDHYAISVNTPSGMQTKTEEFHSIGEKFPILKKRFLRGIVNLIEMMILGYKSINYAADKVLEDDNDSTESNSSFGPWAMIGTFLVSMLFAIFLFKFLPLFAAKGVDSLFPLSTPLFNIVDGLVKLFILVAYMYLIGLMSDIQDVYRYHGAEHKTINCYESKKPLTLKNISTFTTVHKRCGTTFIFVVIFLSVLVYLFIPKDLPFFINLGIRVALLPIIASIGYELQRYSASHSNFLIDILVAPGLLLQKITTSEPSPKHLRAGKAALEAVFKAEKKSN